MRTCRPSVHRPVKERLPGRVDLHIESPVTGFAQARELANREVRKRGGDSLLLAWYEQDTGRYSPNVDCCGEDRPSWQVYAESRGGNLTVYLNEGEFVFLYRHEDE